MAFNFLQIKRLGMMYRAIQTSLNHFPNESLQKTQDLLGQQILEASQCNPTQGFPIHVDCRIRQFPLPKYSIGQYVRLQDENRGIIVGLAYHHGGQSYRTGWWYELDGVYDEEETLFCHQREIEEIVAPWLSPENQGLNKESQALLETFLDHFEKSHGPLFPPEEEAV